MILKKLGLCVQVKIPPPLVSLTPHYKKKKIVEVCQYIIVFEKLEPHKLWLRQHD